MFQSFLRRIRDYNNRNLILAISKSALVLFLPLMLYVVIRLPWWQKVLMFLSMLVFAKFGGQVGIHRYFSHRSFKTGRVREWLLAFFGTLCTCDTILNYAVSHHHHHTHSDEPVDIHSPRNMT